MRPPIITLEQVETLPLVYQTIIPESYRDIMGHMNVRWYVSLFDEAGYPLFDLFGITQAYYQDQQNGTFDLEHHIRYLAEVLIGDSVQIRARVIGHSPKRVHYMLFMVNQTRQVVSATSEIVNTHTNLQTRRTSPYPPEISAKISALVTAHQQLAWDAPVCGTMNA